MGQLIRVNFRKEPTIRDRSVAIRFVSDAYKLELIEAYDEAMDLLQRAVKINPSCFEAVYAMGEVAAKQNDIAGAKAFYHEALALNPDKAGPLFKLGLLELAAEAYDSAIDYFEQALDRDKNLLEVHYLLAETYQRLGNFEGAIKHWNVYLRQSQDPIQLTNARDGQRHCLNELLRAF